MSLSTEELNYLVWRYLQETGLEVSAFALQDESRVHELDSRLKDIVPIGSLVNLIQKGILYSEVDSLVDNNGAIREDKFYSEKFTLLHALGADAAINQPIENTGRFVKEGEADEEDKDEKIEVDDYEENRITESSSREDTPGFIKVLPQFLSFEPSTIAVWNPASSSVLSYGLTDARARILTLSSNGDKTSEQIKIDHVQEFNSFTNDYSSDVTMISWSNEGDYVITGVQYGELRLWSSEGVLKSTLDFHTAPVILILWSPQSTHCLTLDADNSIALWDINTQQVIQNFNFTKTDTTAVIDQLLGLDAEWIDDTRFIIPGLNATAILFSTKDRNPQGTLKGHSKPITQIKFHKDSQSLLTGSDDQTIRIWNGTNFNNSQILTGHSQSISFADWINKDFVISCSLDGSIRIWDVRTGKAIFTYVVEGLPVLLGDLSGDLSLLAVGTSDGTVTVLKLDLLIDVKIKPIGEFQPSFQAEGNNFITSLKWNSESKLIVAGYSQSESVIINVF